jgi:hypothetical protein
MLTVTVEDPEVVKMSQDYCRHGKARKHVCGWRIWPLSVGGSCEYEWECLIGSSGQPVNKCAVTWDLCVGLKPRTVKKIATDTTRTGCMGSSLSSGGTSSPSYSTSFSKNVGEFLDHLGDFLFLRKNCLPYISDCWSTVY